jgi:dienelactone hydrolase
LLLRRILPPAAAAFALACAPSIQQDPAPASVSYAVFDPTTAQIPLPNDLAIQPSTLAGLPAGAQKDLLTAFATQYGFPNDQEVDITIDFTTLQINADGSTTPIAPELDLDSISDTTLRMVRAPGTPVTFAKPVAADYFKGATKGTLTLRNLKDAKGNGPLPWPSSPAGEVYVVGVRGGASGVKLKGDGGASLPINPSATFFLLTRGVDLTKEENQTLIPVDEKSPVSHREQRAAIGKELEKLRLNYQGAFSALASSIPTAELAVLTAFHIAPTNVTVVETDPGRGLIPIPSDFLLDPATGNKTVQQIAAFGPLAAGLATLDGFSTTGPILATLSAPVQASSIKNSSVFLYDMSNPAAPVRVPDSTEGGGVYVSEPLQLGKTSTGGPCAGTAGEVCLTRTIGLQPAVPAAGPGGLVGLPPLKEATEYVVLITNKVQDANNRSLGRSTLAQTLLFPPEHPVAVNGKSQLAGVSDASATGVEQMRQLLHLAIARLQADKNITRDQVVMAYSFRTQSITGAGNATDPAKPIGLIQLAALPYKTGLNTFFVPSKTFFHYTPAQAWTKWGLDSYTPNADIAEVLHGTLTTLDLESDASGAFDPTILTDATGAKIAKALKPVRVLLALPKAASVTAACPGAYGLPAGTKCPPLVVFHHGLRGSKSAMLAVANEYTKAGYLVAAIDGSKHGDRSWCSSDLECAGSTAGRCVKIPFSEHQGDQVAPGLCANGNVKAFTNCTGLACVGAWAGYTDPAGFEDGGPDGYSLNSANYFTTANFFRTRDTLRQDVIDQSALILALSRSPLLPAVSTDAQALRNYLLTQALYVDPLQIYWVGQSLGSILGTLNLAANPRLSRGVLNVGGATLTDILTSAPSFTQSVDELLGSLTPPIARGTPEYLQFLLVAKWILDPADPINFAGHLLGGDSKPTLPNLLTGAGPQAPKSVLGQMAACDQTVPNFFNLGLYNNIGLGPARANAALSLFRNVDPTIDLGKACPAGSFAVDAHAVPHAFITSLGASVGVDPQTGSFTFKTVPAVKSLALEAGRTGALFLADPVNNIPPAQIDRTAP